MLAIRLWNYFKGYVIIRVEGLTLEKFLNLASNNDIYLWDIKRIDYTLLEMKVSTKGFKALKNVISKTGCRVYLVRKVGFPFFVNKLKNRKMLGFGFLLFLGLIFFLTSFIWDIEIMGNKDIKDEKFLSVLEDIGIKIGTIKYNIDESEAKNAILNNIDALSFVNIEIKGTKLVVEVKEQDLPPSIIDKDSPCHIVAKKKGVIEKVIAKNGKSIVKEGDIVNRGQILISGIIEDEDSEKGFIVHSEGEVLAITRYSHQIEEPIIKTIEQETGNVCTMKELKIGKKGIIFSSDEIPFKYYAEEVEEKQLFKGKINLPISMVIRKYKEIEKNKVKQNLEAIKKSTQVKGVEEINKALPKNAKILSKDVNYVVKDTRLVTIVVVEVIEDIGEKQIILNRED